MKTITLKIRGMSPLLMHSGQLADPMSEAARTLSEAVKVAKKNKTDKSYEKMAEAEFMGSLYLDEKLEPCITGEMLEAMICEAARKFKQGKEVKAAVIVDGLFPLAYKGPRDPETLWKTGAYRKTMGVRIGKSRVMRTRPMFTGWAVEFTVHYLEELLSERDIIKFVEKAGAEVGLGDYRPRYGRFEVAA